MLWSFKLDHLQKKTGIGNIIRVFCLFQEFGILELRNRVTQNDATLRVTNSKTFIDILSLIY